MDKNDIKRIILWIALILGLIVAIITHFSNDKKMKEAGFDNKRDYKISLYVNKDIEDDYNHILILTDETLEKSDIVESLSNDGYNPRIDLNSRPTLLTAIIANTKTKHENIIMCGCTFIDYIVYNKAKLESLEDFIQLEENIKLADLELSGLGNSRFIYIIGPKYTYENNKSYEMTYEEYVEIVKERLKTANVEYIDLSNYNAGTFNEKSIEQFDDNLVNVYYTEILSYMKKVTEKDKEELTKFYQENL